MVEIRHFALDVVKRGAVGNPRTQDAVPRVSARGLAGLQVPFPPAIMLAPGYGVASWVRGWL